MGTGSGDAPSPSSKDAQNRLDTLKGYQEALLELSWLLVAPRPLYGGYRLGVRGYGLWHITYPQARTQDRVPGTGDRASPNFPLDSRSRIGDNVSRGQR